MARDGERIDRLQEAMKEAGLDAIACALPANVLLLTGYFPVVGTSLAVVTREREVWLYAPEDEKELAECSGADRVVTFQPPLALNRSELDGKIVGYECGPTFEPMSYVALHLYGTGIPDLLQGAVLRPAGELLARLKAVLTPIEMDRLRRSCRIAEAAFQQGRDDLAAGMKESEAAENFRVPLSTVGIGFEGVSRAGGEVFCMSGMNSAKAYGAYARSRAKEIEISDLVLTHCNSHADGYWTDITRTYTFSDVTDRLRTIYEAIFEARRAAIEAIRPGVQAAEVDRAARGVLRSCGFGEQFKHATGHGVGFAAINHNARPRLREGSEDRLEAGMVFNAEPGIYIEGFGGVRHCDMVAVTESGAEVLTPFHSQLEDLIR